nr:SapC family protein [Novosphingobium flavum]
MRSDAHRNWKVARTSRIAWLAGQNLVPLITEEFSHARRFYPIVFSTDAEPVPLALMSLVPGHNAFVSGQGETAAETYLPAYARRYPFILARPNPAAPATTLCFDPASELLGEDVDGDALFDNGKASQACLKVLRFCEQFDQSGERTRQFVAELVRNDLLVDGRVDVRRDGEASAYNGFRIVDAERLGKVRGHVLRQWAQNGMLELIYSHLHSLDLMPRLVDAARQSPVFELAQEAAE